MSLRAAVPMAVLRGIVRELRLANPKLRPVSKCTAVQHLLKMYRLHDVTEERVCRSPDELLCMGKTYLYYLQSIREYQVLYNQYHGRGERSVQETADLVGFRLPVQNTTSSKEKYD